LFIQQYEQAKIEEARDETAFQVLDRAVPPEEKAKPKRGLILVLTTMLGTFCGVFLAFFREYCDRPVHTREQVERQVRVPLLATIPPLLSPKRRGGRHQSPVVETDLLLHSPQGIPRLEAFRALHMRLRHLNGVSPIQTMLLTSAGPEEDSAMTLVNLALGAAYGGKRTLIVDSNVRHPGLHTLFQCAIAPGLAEILASPEGWRTAVQVTSVANLDLLPAGTMLPTTLAAFESSAFDFLLTQFKEAYDLILFASPPVLGLPDAAVLGNKMDAVCLVLTCGKSRLDDVTEAKTELEAVQAKVIGAILRA
jgi:capsular exopolysaccharide synthesis family protein